MFIKSLVKNFFISNISTVKQNEDINEYNFLTYNKQHYPSHYISNKGIKGTVVNQTLALLHGVSLEIWLTVPLIAG